MKVTLLAHCYLLLPVDLRLSLTTLKSHLKSTYPFLQFDCSIDYFCTEPLKPLVLHYASLNLSLLHYITLHYLRKCISVLHSATVTKTISGTESKKVG